MKYRDGNAKKHTNKIFRDKTYRNHNHYTSLRLLFLIVIIDLLMSTHAILGVFLTCMCKKSIHNFILLLLIIYDPHTTLIVKASLGMYSGCDYSMSYP